MLDTGGIEFTDVLDGDPFVLGNDQLSGRVVEVETSDFATQALGNQSEFGDLAADMEGVELEKLTQDALRRQAKSFEQRGHRHLAPTVDAEEQQVLGVKLEIEP